MKKLILLISLFLMSTQAYCGSIKIGSTFDPTAITGCVLWLDASESSTITLNGSNVSQWDDKSGNSNNATQGTADNQPAYTSTINGKNVVTFSNDWLTLGSHYIFSSNDGLCIFAVVNIQGDISSLRPIYDFGELSESGYGFFADIVNCNYYTPTKAGGVFSGVAHNAGAGNAIISFIIDFNDTQKLRFNGSERSSDNITLSSLGSGYIREYPTRSASTGPVTIGTTSKTQYSATRLFEGDIAEIIVYNDLLTSDEVIQVEGYLSKKWGVVI